MSGAEQQTRKSHIDGGVPRVIRRFALISSEPIESDRARSLDDGEHLPTATPAGSSGVEVHVGPRRLDVPQFADLPQHVSKAHWWGYARLWKPVLDRVGALVLLVVLSPLIAVLALVVRMTMGHPVLFRQVRVGRSGELFVIYKLRTMAPDRRNGDDRKGSSWPNSLEKRRDHKSPNDPRHTPVGRFLRRTSLDELPQLVNVLMGHMSLVGPRPELPDIVKQYAEWQHLRHLVRPGLTGLWQVAERTADRRMHECTDVDLAYIRQLSLLTDVTILVRTVGVPVRKAKSGH